MPINSSKRKTTLIAGIMIAITASTVGAETISIRADNWYPMNGAPGAEKPGYMIELAQIIFGEHGHSVDYQTMPWERALATVRAGEEDCVVGAYKEDAPDFVFPDQKWGLDQSAFYVKADSSWQYDGLNSLKGKKIALIGGYSYGEEFDQYVEKNPGVADFLNANNALELNIRKVIGGRVDALVESPAVLEAQLSEMGLEGKLKKAGDLGEAEPMYIACSPANPKSSEWVQLVDEGTKQLRESGKLQEILSKYGLEDWQ